MDKNDIPEAELEKQAAEAEKVLNELPDDEPRKKSLQTLVAQKAHWRAKAEAAQKELETLKTAKPSEPAPATPPPQENFVSAKEFNSFQQKIELARQGFSDEEITLAEKLAVASGKSIMETAKDKTNEHLFEATRQKNRSEKATPTPSSGSPMLDGKPLSEYTQAEINANWEKIKAMAKEQGGRRGGNL